MSQFKAGDVVVCVNNEGLETILIVGKEYVVKGSCTGRGIAEKYEFVTLKGVVSGYTGSNYEFLEQRFILKQSKPEDKPIQNVNITPNSTLLPLAAIQHYTANNQNLLFSVEDGKLVVTNIEKDQRCVVESLEEAVEALNLLDNISKSYKEWDEFYKEKEHV